MNAFFLLCSGSKVFKVLQIDERVIEVIAPAKKQSLQQELQWWRLFKKSCINVPLMDVWMLFPEPVHIPNIVKEPSICICEPSICICTHGSWAKQAIWIFDHILYIIYNMTIANWAVPLGTTNSECYC